MTLEERLNCLKALADLSRMALVSTLQERPQCVEELAQRLALAPSTISFHLKKLEKAKLVDKVKDQYYTVYSVNDDLFNLTLRQLLSGGDPVRKRQEQRVAVYHEKVLRTFFDQGNLIRIPAQKKKRRIVLDALAALFDKERTYSEREVNEIIRRHHDDHCQIRRLLIEERLMTRHEGQYQRVDEISVLPAHGIMKKKETLKVTNKRDEIKRAYKEMPVKAGIYRIVNRANGKSLVGSSLNIHGPLNRHKMELFAGSHKNRDLLADWRELGEDAFDFEILDTVENKRDPGFNLEEELTLLEEIWKEKMNLDQEPGYNKSRDLRKAFL